MVGVPGRSKGCNTCRKRKIACTLERPHCFQCMKSGRVCLGYQKERIFVTSVSSEKSPETQWRPGAYTKTPLGSIKGESPESRSPDSGNMIIKYENLDKGAFREQMMGLFLNTYKEPTAAGAWPSPLVTIIPTLTSSSNSGSPAAALQKSALAVCTSRLARGSIGHGDDVLARTSLQLYGQAMHSVRKALEHPSLMLADETLATCLMMALYEVLECPGDDRSAYLNHYHGCAKLIQMRGPDAHRSGMAHVVFRAFRTMGTFEGLLNKQTFLADPVWKTKTFSDSMKSPFDKLLDIMLDGPAVIHSAEAAFKHPSPRKQLEEAIKVARACLKLDMDMQQYYDDLKAEANGTIYWPVFPEGPRIEDPDDDAPKICPVEFHFVDPRVASTMMVYWATVAIIWSGLCQLYGAVDQLSQYLAAVDAAAASVAGSPDSFMSDDPPTRTPSLADLPPLGHRRDFISMIRNVFQSFEFCVRDDVSLPLSATPLNMCLGLLMAWPGYEREIEWCERALKRVRLAGVGMVKCLPRDSANPKDSP